MLLTERAGVRGDNQNNNFPDQFAAQVITTAQDRVVVRVKRLDAMAAGVRTCVWICSSWIGS
jgi:hypothetical protein